MHAFPIMTFNLRCNVPSDGLNAWPHRAAAAAELIRSYAPWIVGTQEGTGPMLADLDEGLTAYRRLGLDRSGRQEDEYNAIFYNDEALEVQEQGQFWLSEQPDVPGSVSWDTACSRICTWARFGLQTDPSVRFEVFNTHLDHVSGEAREKGIRLIRRFMAERRRNAPLPMFVTGDFNAEPGEPPVKLMKAGPDEAGDTLRFTDAFSLLEEPPGRTFHEFAGGTEGEPIDYIFATDDVRLANTGVLRDQRGNGRYVSDHYPVIAEAELSASGG